MDGALNAPSTKRRTALATKEAQTNKEKLEWHLLWMEGLEAVVRVMMAGKKKYGANNWRTGKPFKKEEVLNAIMRHAVALYAGEEIDEVEKGGVGEGHWANIICEALFYGFYETHDMWNYADSELMNDNNTMWAKHHETGDYATPAEVQQLAKAVEQLAQEEPEPVEELTPVEELMKDVAARLVEEKEEERGLAALEALIAKEGGDTRPQIKNTLMDRIRRKYA